ncbi:MAG: hypothetical protein WKF33_06085 [Thermoleophilaceae bacterium]
MLGKEIFDQFRLTDEEALTLAAAKLWLMQHDLDKDPDPEDICAKRPVILEYALALHRACEAQFGAEGVPDANPTELRARVDHVSWAPAVRRALGDLPFDKARALCTNWSVVAGMLSKVRRRDRAVLLCVELAVFYPWPQVRARSTRAGHRQAGRCHGRTDHTRLLRGDRR